MVAQASTFRKYWMLGYRNLVPIVPPDANISEKSSLFKRPRSKGKAVGIMGQDGAWRGFDWIKASPPTEDDVDRWNTMGAGLGIRTGMGLIAIDIDSLDPQLSDQAEGVAREILGPAPCRIGKAPKRLLLYRVSSPTPYTRVEFTGHDKENERVELLSDGRQFVASGIHPDTLKPYSWTTPTGEPPALDDLTTVTPEQIARYFAKLATVLPAATAPITEGSLNAYDQEGLAGDPDMVRAAVRATPNTSALFPTRDAYRDFGYAIKAALPDDEDVAKDIFQEWCARWDKGTNDPDIVNADWRRMKPPYRRGAQWLYELADKHSGGLFREQDAWFQPIVDSDNPFAPTAASIQNELKEDISWIRPSTWAGKQPATREWEVEGWIPKGEVTLLYGDGGIGKTLLIHQYATSAAAGIPWLGQPTRKARVMCFFCEDSEDELHRRQLDINRSLGVTFDEIDDHLLIASRKYMDNLFILWDRNTGAMKRQAIWAQLLNDAIAHKADVIIVDTIADTYGGSEIDRGQVNAFVKSCLGKLAQTINGSVIALGHPSITGKISGSGTSGSTAWSNAARSRLYLKYPKNVEKGDVRELEGMKSNYGPKGSVLKLKWVRGAFDVLAGTVLMNSETGEGRHIPTLENATDQAVLEVLATCSDVSLALGNPRLRNYAPRVLKLHAPSALESYSLETIGEALERMEAGGVIAAREIGRSESRKAIMGYRVVLDNLSAEIEDETGVFA